MLYFYKLCIDYKDLLSLKWVSFGLEETFRD